MTSLAGLLGASRMEVVGLTVRDIDAAIADFERLLGTTFLRFTFTSDTPIEHLPCDGDDAAALSPVGTVVAIDLAGYVELIQTDPPVERDGMRNIHLKVDDIDGVIERLRSSGLRVVANMRIGGLREAIVDPEDMHGLRLCLVAYEAPSMIEAMLEADTAR